MQAPDANGFVSITWPSQSVPYGGVFHTHLVKHSAEKYQFLKELLQESKLNITLRQKSLYKLRQPDETITKRATKEIPFVRPRTSRRRSLSTIRESGAYETNNFRPVKHGVDRENLKDKLANTMAYGDQPDQPKPPIKIGRLAPKPLIIPNEKDKWHSIVTQIRERAQWLAEMEELGEAAPHRDIIHAQIAERMRLLEALGLEYASPSSSARTHKSGFSTLRSREDIQSVRSKGSYKSNSSTIKTKTSSSGKSTKGNNPTKPVKICDENVKAYNSVLRSSQHTPK